MVKQITRLASPLDRSGSDTLQRLAAGVATSLNQDARLQTVEEHNFVRNTKTSAIPHQPALTDGGSNWPLSPWEAPEKYPRGELYRSMKDSWTTSNEIQRSMGDHLDLKTTSTTSTRLDSMIQYLHLEALIQKANYPIPKSYNIVKCSSEIPDSKAWSQFSKKAWKTQPEFQERVRKVEMELTKRIDDLHQVLNSDQKESYVYYRDWIRQAIVRYEGSATSEFQRICFQGSFLIRIQCWSGYTGRTWALSTEEKTAINDSQLAFRNKNPLEFHFGMAYACVAAGIGRLLPLTHAQSSLWTPALDLIEKTIVLQNLKRGM